MIWLLLSLSTASANEPEVLSDHLTARSLSPTVHVFNAEPWSANTLVVEMKDGRLVLVDTPPTPLQTQQILDWLGARYGKREVIAVNSHHHLDASGGNQALAAAGIPIYGNARTVERMAESGEGMLVTLAESFADDPFMSEALKTLQLTPPDHPFPEAEGLTMDFGGESLVLIAPGHAHSADNIVAWFPEHRILYGGCMVKDGDSLGYMGEADTASWTPAIQTLIALDPEVVVPGHGTTLTPALLKNTARLLGEID